MTLKIWRGDAPAVAQVTRITPSSVEIGDVFTLTINGKSINVTATAATVSNVCTLLTTALAATTILEFREFTVVNATTWITLTASTAGVPFIITASSTNGSSLGVTVATVRNGAAAGSGSNMTQTFKIPIATAGNFQIFLGGEASSLLAVGSSAATVQTALEALTLIGAGNVSVSKTTDTNDSIYVVEFIGALANTNVALMIVQLPATKPLIRTTQEGSSTGTIQNEIQTVDIGFLSTSSGVTYTLTFSGQTTSALDVSATAETVEAALEALSNLTQVNVSKSGSVYTIEFVSVNGNTNQPQMSSSVYSASTTSGHDITVTSTSASGSGSGAVNEQQTVTLTGTPSGGTFTITFDGQTTSAIAYNASAATVEAALEALSNITAGDVDVTGSAGGPWTVDFVNGMAAANQPQMTANGASLTGGSGQALAVSEITASAGPNHWDTAANWLPSGVPATGDDVRFEFGSVQCLYGLSQASVTLTSLALSMAYSGRIGLTRLNSSGYVEYRTTDLTIGATTILVGYGSGSGPSKVALNTGSVQAAIELRDAGGSAESGIATVTWRGTHASNAIQLFGGDLGIAPYSDQSAVVDTLIQRGGTLDAKHTAFTTSLLFTSAKFYDCTLSGSPIEAY